MKQEDPRIWELYSDTKARAIDLYNKQNSVERIEESEVKRVICEANRVLAFPENVGTTKDHKDAYKENTSEGCDRVLLTFNPHGGPTQVNTHS